MLPFYQKMYGFFQGNVFKSFDKRRMLKMSVNKRNKSNKTSSSETFSSNVKLENIEKL